MNKAKKAVKTIKELCDALQDGYKYDDIFYALFDEALETIETALKALEIIKKKRVDVDLFFTILEDKNQENKLRAYNAWNKYNLMELTKEEFKLLKKLLK